MADQEELEKQVEELEHPSQDNSEEHKKKKKKSALKYALNISLVLIATAIAIFFTLYKNFFTIIDNLKKCDYRWVALIIGIMLGCILLRSLILTFFAKMYSRKYHLHQGLAVDQIGIFYSAVTPGGSGGEIMQAYTYKKQGVPISSAVSIMAMYSIVYQVVLILYGLLSFILKYERIIQLSDMNILGLRIPIWVLTIFGFAVNVSVILIILLMAYWRGFHRFIMGPLISFLNKIRIVKNPEKQREKLRVQVENFKIEFRRLMTNIPLTLLIAFLFFCYMTLRYSVPFFVGLALHNESTTATFWDSVFLGNFHQMVTGLIPIPGAAGVSELFFHELFVDTGDLTRSFYLKIVEGGTLEESKNASDALCQSALLLWRSITFVFPMAFAGLVTAFYKSSPKEEMEQKGIMPDRGTLTEVQQETLTARQQELDTFIETQQLSQKAVLDRLKILSNKNNKKKYDEHESDNNDDIKNIDINEEDE